MAYAVGRRAVGGRDAERAVSVSGGAAVSGGSGGARRRGGVRVVGARVAGGENDGGDASGERGESVVMAVKVKTRVGER